VTDLAAWLQAVFLGILQGLTEFLPISSSAHLRIFPDLFGWRDPGASFTAVIQIGTEVAVLLFFRREIWRIISTWTRSLVRPALRSELDARLGWYVIIGTIPIGILGVVFKDDIKTGARNLWLIAVMLVVMGLVLGLAEKVGTYARPLDRLTTKDAVLCGLAQSAALVPGVSRSGATISMGLALGQEREAATRFAFLMAIPAVVAAGLFQLKDISEGDSPYSGAQTALATVVSFAVGYAAIAWLLRYVSTHSYLPFVIYRVALGVLLMVLLSAGVLKAKSDIEVHGPPATVPGVAASAGVTVPAGAQ
jgi:undecaprenyl-diphosphatase